MGARALVIVPNSMPPTQQVFTRIVNSLAVGHHGLTGGEVLVLC